VLLSSCAPRILEWNVRMGELADRKTAYFAYCTDLPPRNPSEVYLILATREKIQGHRIFRGSSTAPVYPRVAYDPERLYVPPEALGGSLPDTTAPTEAAGDTLVLGYFMTPIESSSPDMFVGDKEKGATKGIDWRQLSDRYVHNVKNAIPAMLDQASRVGAHGVIDVAVFWTSNNRPWGPAGLYLTGRAVAIGTVARE
jgi:hypothetical protein